MFCIAKLPRNLVAEEWICKVKVNRIIEKTASEGPGVRFCIYFQGCDIRCKGCANKEMWDFNGGVDIEVSTVLKKINKIKNEICGITFLGGEPTCQAKDAAQIAQFAKKQNLNVILFSGNRYEELVSSGDENVIDLLSNTDLLIDGKFEQTLLDYSRPLCGSSNQRFFYLTDAISSKEIEKNINRYEVVIDRNGVIKVNGMGDLEKIQKIIDTRV